MVDAPHVREGVLVPELDHSVSSARDVRANARALDADNLQCIAQRSDAGGTTRNIKHKDPVHPHAVLRVTRYSLLVTRFFNEMGASECEGMQREMRGDGIVGGPQLVPRHNVSTQAVAQPWKTWTQCIQ